MRDPAAEHLHGGRQQRVRTAAARGATRTTRAPTRTPRSTTSTKPIGLPLSVAPPGSSRSATPQKPTPTLASVSTRHALPGHPPHQHDPQRHRRDHERREATTGCTARPRSLRRCRRPPAASPTSQTRRAACATASAPKAPRGSARSRTAAARGDEARGAHQERRHRLDGDADGEVRRAPDHVDDAEAQPDERRRSLLGRDLWSLSGFGSDSPSRATAGTANGRRVHAPARPVRPPLAV